MSQNEQKTTDLKKSKICPIWHQSESIVGKIWPPWSPPLLRCTCTRQCEVGVAVSTSHLEDRHIETHVWVWVVIRSGDWGSVAHGILEQILTTMVTCYRGGRLRLKVCQIDPKWDKSGTYFIQFSLQYILDRRSVDMKKVPDFSHLGPIRHLWH